MRRTRAWLQRAVGMLTRRRRLRELDEELQVVLDMHVEDNLRTGMTPEEARRRAHLALGGGVAPLREAYRDRLGLPSVDALVQDVRFGWRMLRRTPAVSLFAIVAISLGVGVNTMVFSLANAVLFKRLPVADADRLVFVGTWTPDRGGDIAGLSWPEFLELRARARSVTSLAAAVDTAADLTDDGGYAESFQGQQVTADAFSAMGLRPLAGRSFVETDGGPGAPPVAMLAERVWRSRYGSDPALVGRTVRLNGTPTTIVGVAQQAPLIGEGHTGVWTPLIPEPSWNNRTRRRLTVFGRLAPGETIESAGAEVRAIGGAIAAAFPDTNRDVPFLAADFRGYSLPARVRLLFLVMLGAVGFVLLVACANVANLLLARAAGRGREVAIRTAVGASRGRVIRQLLIESLILSVFGGALGLLVAVWGVRAFDLALVDTHRPLWLDFSVDVTVLGYLALIVIATTLLFGLAPAWRVSKVSPTSVLKEATPGGGRRRSRIMSTLVVTEMALAVILLAGAGVMIRTFLNVTRVELGVERDHLHTFRMNTARYYESPEDRLTALREVVARLAAIPGVEAAAVTSSLPLHNSSLDAVVEFAADSPGQLAEASVASTLGAYDRAVGAPLRDGRFLSAADATTTPAVAVVNEAFARRSWPEQSALGKQFQLTMGRRKSGWLTVVGVMGNVAQRERQVQRPFVYVPYVLVPDTDVGVVVRSATSPAALFPDIRATVRDVNPNIPLLELETFEHRFYVRQWPERVFGSLFAIFGGIALLLAAVGLYGVTSYSASQRQHEIGVRVALGATRRDVMRHIASESLTQAALALVIGLAGAAALTRLLSAQLVDVSPNDPATFAAVVFVLMTTAVAGCVVPVRRALGLNPVEALRHE